MVEDKLSIIIPIYNEEGNILPLYKEIKEEISKNFLNFEIIYVNDNSNDNSLNELLSLQDITILNLNKNYGQSIAFDAGFKYATGDLIVSLDGDGQNNPKDIKNLYDKMIEGNFDVVAGWRKNRKDKKSIKILTKIGRVIRKKIIADVVNDQGCSLRIYKIEAAKSLDIGGEMHRYILSILRWKGFKIGEIVVDHRPRIYGKSKYTSKKAIRGSIDLIYVWFIQKYSQRPLHLFGSLGFISFLIAFLSGVWTIYEKIEFGLSLNRNGWFFVTAFLIIVGIILFSFGIIIDLLIKNNFNSSKYENRYYLREIIKK